MNSIPVDHTDALETRLKAIRILPEDRCVFFRERENSTIGLRQCQYCRFATFNADATYDMSGLCKFKA